MCIRVYVYKSIYAYIYLRALRASPPRAFFTIGPWECYRFIRVSVYAVQCRSRFGWLCGFLPSAPLVEFGCAPQAGFCTTRLEVASQLSCILGSFLEALQRFWLNLLSFFKAGSAEPALSSLAIFCTCRIRFGMFYGQNSSVRFIDHRADVPNSRVGVHQPKPRMKSSKNSLNFISMCVSAASPLYRRVWRFQALQE